MNTTLMKMGLLRMGRCLTKNIGKRKEIKKKLNGYSSQFASLLSLHFSLFCRGLLELSKSFNGSFNRGGSMKNLIAGMIAFVLFMIPSIPGSSHIPKDIQVVQKAIRLDSILEAEWNSHNAILNAQIMDSNDQPHLYSAEDVLELYYRDPKAIKLALFKMGRTKRIKLLNEVIDELSDMYGVNSYTIKAIVKQESYYNPKAISPKGAIGIMQLMPSTAKMMGVRDIANPIENIIGGIKYVKHLSDIFSWKTHLVLAAYNAGPGAVKKHRGIPPYDETIEYVEKVIQYRKEFKHGTFS